MNTTTPGGRGTGLRIHHEATRLARLTYSATATFPAAERASLGDQMRRAAVSVAANLAEGCGRATRADRVRLLAVAWGSLRELEAHVGIAHAVALLPPTEEAELRTACRHTGRLLHALRTSPNL